MNLESMMLMELTSIKGIGEKGVAKLAKLNIYSIEDLISYYPYRYQVLKIANLAEIKEDAHVTIRGRIITDPKVSYIRKNLNRLSFTVIANNKTISVVIFNRAFLKPYLKVGREIIIEGNYQVQKNNMVASSVYFELFSNVRVIPVYHLVSGVNNNELGKWISQALEKNCPLCDYVPTYLTKEYQFIDKLTAAKIIHKPSTLELLKRAKLRLIYEELFVFMFKINYLAYKNKIHHEGLERNVGYEQVESFITSLPFVLTDDQQSAVKQIYADLVAPYRMNRLLLGDVGSGKTVVAILGLYINYLSGYQGALMAPTEILAIQHYYNILELFKDFPIHVEVLVGSMSKREKKNVLQKLSNGEIDILIGTHALITDHVAFPNLGLVITDEQHRFGVNQRSNLQNKGRMPDVMYLSATPIPRTYALTLYGDMDTSFIKSKPMGRKEIITKALKESKIKEMLAKLFEEIKLGHQAYVVAPIIESDEESDMKDVYLLEKKFHEAFGTNVKIGVLHGKLKQEEKEAIMNDFKNGKLQILISTTVIEVGIDVKNATMMIIFNAERFGLATLHQLRGRVGRSDLQSYCYLISNKDTPRLHVMEESNDGFYISEKDFELRGEGDLFGVKQSGDMTFKIADLHRDYKILVKAKEDAVSFIEQNINESFERYPVYQKMLEKLNFID